MLKTRGGSDTLTVPKWVADTCSCESWVDCMSISVSAAAENNKVGCGWWAVTLVPSPMGTLLWCYPASLILPNVCDSNSCLSKITKDSLSGTLRTFKNSENPFSLALRECQPSSVLSLDMTWSLPLGYREEWNFPSLILCISLADGMWPGEILPDRTLKSPSTVCGWSKSYGTGEVDRWQGGRMSVWKAPTVVNSGLRGWDETHLLYHLHSVYPPHLASPFWGTGLGSNSLILNAITIWAYLDTRACPAICLTRVRCGVPRGDWPKLSSRSLDNFFKVVAPDFPILRASVWENLTLYCKNLTTQKWLSLGPGSHPFEMSSWKDGYLWEDRTLT